LAIFLYKMKSTNIFKTLTFLSILGLAAPIAKAENSIYSTFGSATNQGSPGSLDIGVNLLGEFYPGLSAGVNLGSILDGNNSEEYLGVTLRKHLGDWDLSSYGRLGLTTQEEPLRTGGPGEPIPERTSSLGISLLKRLTETLRARLDYQRNFSGEEVVQNGYPTDRLSLGLEKTF
jgi:hypothetical protein